jgi:hypothetical protein
LDAKTQQLYKDVLSGLRPGWQGSWMFSMMTCQNAMPPG